MRRFFNNFPFVKQKDAMQCGITCLRDDMQILWKGVFDRISFQVLFCHNRGVSLLGISEAAAQLGLQTTCGRSGDGQCHCCECTQEQQPIFLEIDEEEFINQLNDWD